MDAIRNTMKKIDVEGLRRINNSIVNRSIRNKIFEDETLGKHIIAAIDGKQILDSKRKSVRVI